MPGDGGICRNCAGGAESDGIPCSFARCIWEKEAIERNGYEEEVEEEEEEEEAMRRFWRILGSGGNSGSDGEASIVELVKLDKSPLDF